MSNQTAFGNFFLLYSRKLEKKNSKTQRMFVKSMKIPLIQRKIVDAYIIEAKNTNNVVAAILDSILGFSKNTIVICPYFFLS